MNAIILCGGLSTRLGEITASVPKILLEIGGKTVLDHQLEKIKRGGIDTVVMAAGHLSHVLQEQIGPERNGVKIIYAVEKEKLGTGGAIKFALSCVPTPNEPTFILNGDILTTVSLEHMAKNLKPESDGIILAAHVDDVASYGTLEYDREFHLNAFKEKEGIHKSGYQNGGFYLFTPKVSQYFPSKNSFSIEYDVFPNMKNLFVFESNESWIDIGIPERLEWARAHADIFEIR
jgi:D-glycero-alpha-D-manno-heptose 1-phosphate guanylyltransferase